MMLPSWRSSKEVHMDPLNVPGKLDSLERIAGYIKTAAVEADLDQKSAYRLRLAVDEVVTNIINHGYGRSRTGGMINVRAITDEKSLAIYIEDTAAPFNPLKIERPQNLQASMEERKEGGLGIFLARQNVDEFLYEYEDGRNRNILIMDRKV